MYRWGASQETEMTEKRTERVSWGMWHFSSTFMSGEGKETYVERFIQISGGGIRLQKETASRPVWMEEIWSKEVRNEVREGLNFFWKPTSMSGKIALWGLSIYL